jgi:hypothetical protein
MGERVVINTDDLRELARRLAGGVGQLGEVKLDLVRIQSQLADQQALYSRVQQILAGIDRLGTTINADHDQVAREVLELEAEEGTAPASSNAIEPASPSQIRAVELSPLVLLLLRRRFEPTATPPQPWDKQWVNSDGTMPPQPSVAARAGFGTSWEARGSFGDGPITGSGRVSASASGWVYGEAEAGRTADGGYRASAQAGAGMGTRVEAEGKIDAGPVHAQGRAEASLEASAKAGGSVQVGPDGVSAQGSAEARATAEASASGKVGVDGVGSVGGEASATAGAEASARGGVGVGADGLTVGAGAGAMAGASAGAGYSVDGPGGTRVGSEVSVKAGVGAEIGVGGEFGWDRVGISLDAGVALGIGLGVSLDISFSPSALLESLSPESLLDTLVGSVESVIDTVGDVADAVSDFFDPPGNPNELLDRPRPDAAPPPPQPGPADVSTPGVGISASASVSPEVPVGVSASASVSPEVPVGVSASASVSPEVPVGVSASASVSPEVPAGASASASVSPAGPAGASAEASVSHPVLRAEVGSPAAPEPADLSRLPEAVRDVLATGAVVGAEVPPVTSLPLAELQERVKAAVDDFLGLGVRTWS